MQNLGPHPKLTETEKKVKVKVAQLCQTLCHSMDCIHGILQATVLEWEPFPSNRNCILKKAQVISMYITTQEASLVAYTLKTASLV